MSRQEWWRWGQGWRQSQYATLSVNFYSCKAHTQSDFSVLAKKHFQAFFSSHANLSAFGLFSFPKTKIHLSNFHFQLTCAILSSLESNQLLESILENSSFVSFLISGASTPFSLWAFFKKQCHNFNNPVCVVIFAAKVGTNGVMWANRYIEILESGKSTWWVVNSGQALLFHFCSLT